MKNIKKRGVKGVLVTIAALAVICAVVMLLWNWLIPELFGLPSISFWQAFGLFLLSRILFGRFGFGGRGMMMHERGNHLREKWRNMTPEQRKEFINKRRKAGFGGSFWAEHFDREAEAQQGDGDK